MLVLIVGGGEVCKRDVRIRQVRTRKIASLLEASQAQFAWQPQLKQNGAGHRSVDM